MSAAATLRTMGACSEAVEWAKEHGGDLATLWRDCPRVDWLLWYATKAGTSRKDSVRAAAGCAELALPYAGPTRNACEAAIAAARAWAEAPGLKTATAAGVAANAARAAADAADAADAVDAVRAAGYAARAAYAAYATYAADAATYAAYAATYAAGAGGKMQAACADVVRACVPFVEVAS